MAALTVMGLVAPSKIVFAMERSHQSSHSNIPNMVGAGEGPAVSHAGSSTVADRGHSSGSSGVVVHHVQSSDGSQSATNASFLSLPDDILKHKIAPFLSSGTSKNIQTHALLLSLSKQQQPAWKVVIGEAKALKEDRIDIANKRIVEVAPNTPVRALTRAKALELGVPSEFIDLGPVYNLAPEGNTPVILSGLAPKEMSQSEAIDFCESIGARLPTRSDMMYLSRALGSTNPENPQKEKYFKPHGYNPKIITSFERGGVLWSSSSTKVSDGYYGYDNYIFYARNGKFSGGASSGSKLGVRCIYRKEVPGKYVFQRVFRTDPRWKSLNQGFRDLGKVFEYTEKSYDFSTGKEIVTVKNRFIISGQFKEEVSYKEARDFCTQIGAQLPSSREYIAMRSDLRDESLFRRPLYSYQSDWNNYDWPNVYSAGWVWTSTPETGAEGQRKFFCVKRL